MTHIKEWILVGIKVEKDTEIMQNDPAGTWRMLSRVGKRRNRGFLIHKDAADFPFMLLLSLHSRVFLHYELNPPALVTAPLSGSKHPGEKLQQYGRITTVTYPQ